MLRSSGWICRSCLLRAFGPITRRPAQRLYSSATTQSESLSKPLLDRARSLAAEHTKLSDQLANDFDARTAKKVGELTRVVQALNAWDKANDSLDELNTILTDQQSDAELRSLAADDIASTSDELSQLSRSLELALVPSHPFEHLPCLLEIRPGAGGSEAAIFAWDLLRMYQAYCTNRGLRSSLLKFDQAESTGSAPNAIQEAILEVENEGAYGLLRCEAGVHRVQRVPATESKGRVHTSAASVLVLPSFPTNGSDSDQNIEEMFNDPNSDYYIDPKDVRTDIMRARGAGGQHVNTTDSAVRLTHLPTNTVVSMQDFRSQPKNREAAWRLLRAKIAQARREAREEEMVNLRRSVVGVAKMGRGDKVRTYNYNQQRVTDHRTGITVHDLQDIMEGDGSLESIMESVRSWLSDQELEELMISEQAHNQSQGQAQAQQTSKGKKA